MLNQQRMDSQRSNEAVQMLEQLCILPGCIFFFVGSSTYDRAIGLQSRSDLLSRKREAYGDTAAVLSRDRRDWRRSTKIDRRTADLQSSACSTDGYIYPVEIFKEDRQVGRFESRQKRFPGKIFV